MRGLLSLIVFVSGVCLSAGGQVLRPEAPSHMRMGQFIYKVPQGSGSHTDAEGALWVEASGGATSGSCPSNDACTMTYALSSVADNGTIIIQSGTYTGDVDISGANHDNITITAPASVKNALTWTCGSAWVTSMSQTHGGANVDDDCGIVSGTDNRPLWTGDWYVGTNGVTVDHLRMRQGASPSAGFCTFVEISATGVTLSRNEIFNGCTIVALNAGAKGVRILYNYIHTGGVDSWPTCGGNDSHGIGVYNFDSATAASAFGSATVTPTSTSGMVVSHNTLTDTEGDGMQELGMYDYFPAPSQYLLQEFNHVYNNCEQGLDYKGTKNVIIRYNDIHENGFGGIGTNDDDAGGDNDGGVCSGSEGGTLCTIEYMHLDWWVYGNDIHDHADYGFFSQEEDDGRWMVWNNIFRQNCTNPGFNWAAFNNPPPNSRVEHNVFWDNNRTAGSACSGLLAERGSTVTVGNNIFYNNGTGSNGNIYSGSDATIDNNRCYPTTPGTCGDNAETNSADDFTDKANNDFTLVSGAQSVDAGTTLSANDANHTITLDLAGNTRSGSWDHGAYERQAPPPPSPEALLRSPWLRRAAPRQGVGIGQLLRAVVLASGQRPPQDAGLGVHDGRVALELHDARVGLKGHGDPREVMGKPDLIAHGQVDSVAVAVGHRADSIAQVGR